MCEDTFNCTPTIQVHTHIHIHHDWLARLHVCLHVCLHVAKLKIDQSFVRDMLEDPDDLAILQGRLASTGRARHANRTGAELIALEAV